jgi:glutaminase
MSESDLQTHIDEIVATVPRGPGRVADYIPALARIAPERFGMAYVTLEGRAIAAGDWGDPFSIQSISKLFTLSLVLARDGETLWKRVGREPSGNPFNSLVQLEHERGIPRNPFINAGALVVSDRLLSLEREPLGALISFLCRESGNPALCLDEEVAASEAEHGHRNAALAHFMAAYGNLENPVSAVLDLYFRHCAITMTCLDLARCGLFLARHGVGNNGNRLLSRSEAKRLNAMLLTCGTYDAAGDFAYRVGLPVKSGVGGGLLAILPGRGALATWGPALDERGNSVAGLEALDRFTTATGWSVF